MYDVKQVILVRKDLNIRKGKFAAQVAHASMKVFFDLRVKSKSDLVVPLTPAMAEWVTGSFAKIVLFVENEEALLEAYKLAQEAKLPCALVTDSGYTEFHGVPTHTTVAIGPALSEDIDTVTGPEGLILTKLA